VPRYDPGIRLHVDAPLAAGLDVPLSSDQAHYLRNVMRAAPGAAVHLFNGRDGEWRGVIAVLDKRKGTIAVAERTRPQTAAADLWLVFAPIKRARIDFIAQKATELGVSGLWPVMTRYTDVARVNDQRLHANAVEAAEQCARLNVPEIFAPERLDRALDRWPAGRRILLCDETATHVPLADALAAERARMPEPWAVLIGPEGGFAPEELARLHEMDTVVRVGLGERLLRADTAALAALACWQAILGDWRGG
jgi:16S rRNA (uracil1498-N3)-methyltransferase